MDIYRAGRDDTPLLSEIIRNSYITVARRFNLTAENCPKHPSNCTDDWVAGDFTRGVIYYLLADRGIPAACAAMEIADETTCYLERLAVLPKFRGRGMGRALVNHVFDQASKSGRQSISIGIIAGQHDLKSWYQNLGFTKTGTRHFDHLPFEVMFMECSLKNLDRL
jgi:GNAT superfamily N-acetyltransferase